MHDGAANKRVCIAFLTLISQRRFDEAIGLVDDNVVWWVQGNWEMPSTHYGKAGVKRLLDLLDGAVAGDLAIGFGALTAEDDRVCVEMHARAPLRNGGRYDMTYHYLFRVRHGLIAEGKEYLDTRHLAQAVFRMRDPAVHDDGR